MPFRHGFIMQVIVSLSLFLQVLTFSKLSNFMCVDNLSYDFHPRLNFVVGPNGSGKSTLVCAIYLCLNGDVKKLGRGSSLVHYINHARPEMPASVTVVLCEKSKLFCLLGSMIGNYIFKETTVLEHVQSSADGTAMAKVSGQSTNEK